MSGWLIYFWTRLDCLNGFAVACVVFLFVALFISLIAAFVLTADEDERAVYYRKWVIRFIVALFLSGLVCVSIPTQKEAAMIYVIPKMAKSETFNELSKSTPEITKLALEALKEQLQTLTKKDDKHD